MLSLSRLAVLFVCALTICGAHAQDPLPWALRAHYSFPTANGTLDFAEDKAELRLRAKDDTVLADGLGFLIKLEDGTELRAEDLGKPSTMRLSDIETPSGTADRYTITYPGQDGLKVMVSMTKPEQWPYIVSRVSVTNDGGKPTGIASIAPIVAETGDMAGFSADTQYVPRRVSMRGGQPVFNNVGEPLAARFVDKQRNFILALGVLPAGEAKPSVEFTSFNGEWQGQVVSNYQPARKLAHGDTLASDRVAISYGMTDPEKIDTYYSWGLTMNNKPRPVTNAPPAWVTVDDAGSLSELISSGSRWSREGIVHALIPATWEGRPGSMEGASPRYPKGMGSAAQQISQAGLVPGIAFDALSTDKDGEGTLASADGQSWLNPTTPQGVDLLRKKVAKLVDWDFAFIAVANSMVPDDVLAAHGITRAQADAAAFATIREAAGTLPIYPVSEGTINLETQAWNEAAEAVTKMKEYGAAPAPVRLAVEDLDTVPPAVIEAIRRWPGVIELLGVPKNQGLRELGDVVGPMRLTRNQ
jgi:hypothetical protein